MVQLTVHDFTDHKPTTPERSDLRVAVERCADTMEERMSDLRALLADRPTARVAIQETTRQLASAISLYRHAATVESEHLTKMLALERGR